VAYAAGGGGDLTARIIAEKVSQNIGVPVVIENIGGANGTIAATRVAQADADGHAIYYSEIAVFTLNPLLMKNLNYSYRDFQAVTLGVKAPLIALANQDVPAANLKELRTHLAGGKNEVLFATVGRGSKPSIAVHRFQRLSGLNIREIPYQAVAPIFSDVLSNRVQMTFLTPSRQTSQYLESGKLKALGITNDERFPTVPEIPTFREQGLQDLVQINYYGFFVPAKTDRAIVDRLQKEIAKAVNDPGVKKRLETEGFQIGGETPAEFDAIVRKEAALLAEEVAQSKLDEE
jgi:tripartite-type tricarboxylate transporter receptor subunit TctC